MARALTAVGDLAIDPEKGLNSAEELRVAEILIEHVVTRLGPLDAFYSVGQGMLEAALMALQGGREIVEGWPRTDLPMSLEEVDDQRGTSGQRTSAPSSPLRRPKR